KPGSLCRQGRPPAAAGKPRPGRDRGRNFGYPRPRIDDRPDARPRWRRTPRLVRNERPDAPQILTDATLDLRPTTIRKCVRTLPSGPGVYRMLDEAGAVIYVGKARNLKARVSNYTRYEGNPVRIARMIAATRSMEFVRTETESAALLLEANLIKRLRPRFNVLLRDDKTFPYILIATDHEAPELTKHRGA